MENKVTVIRVNWKIIVGEVQLRGQVRFQVKLGNEGRERRGRGDWYWDS